MLEIRASDQKLLSELQSKSVKRHGLVQEVEYPREAYVTDLLSPWDCCPQLPGLRLGQVQRMRRWLSRSRRGRPDWEETEETGVDTHGKGGA